MLGLYNEDNIVVLDRFISNKVECDLIYADMIYDNRDFRWIDKSYSLLKEGGIFIIQTDYHTVANVKLHLDDLGLDFINWCIYIQEWGGVPHKAFPRKHDDILIYSKGLTYKWYGDRIQIPKITAGTAFDKKGTGLKTPCDVFYDLGNFSTIDKERVQVDGTNIAWQKPLKLMNRLLLPFTDEKDLIIDPFLGTGTTGVWAIRNNRSFLGIELDTKLYNIAKERIHNEYVHSL